MRHLSDYEVAKIAHVADRETYEKNQYILREGSEGDTFYIIVKGKCNVYQLDKATNAQKFIRSLTAGTHFGEKALKNECKRKFGIKYFLASLVFLSSALSVYKLYSIIDP